MDVFCFHLNNLRNEALIQTFWARNDFLVMIPQPIKVYFEMSLKAKYILASQWLNLKNWGENLKLHKPFGKFLWVPHNLGTSHEISSHF